MLRRSAHKRVEADSSPGDNEGNADCGDDDKLAIRYFKLAGPIEADLTVLLF